MYLAKAKGKARERGRTSSAFLGAGSGVKTPLLAHRACRRASRSVCRALPLQKHIQVPDSGNHMFQLPCRCLDEGIDVRLHTGVEAVGYARYFGG
jgi:hypothetical protein